MQREPHSTGLHPPHRIGGAFVRIGEELETGARERRPLGAVLKGGPAHRHRLERLAQGVERSGERAHSFLDLGHGQSLAPGETPSAAPQCAMQCEQRALAIVRQLDQGRCFTRLVVVRPHRIAQQLHRLCAAVGRSEEAGGGLRELVGLIQHHRFRSRQQLAEALLPQHHVGEERGDD